MVEGEPLPQVRWEMGDGQPLHDNVHVSKAAVTLREMFFVFLFRCYFAVFDTSSVISTFSIFSVFYKRFLIVLLSLR